MSDPTPVTPTVVTDPTPGEPHSSWYYYVCEHGAYNQSPCPIHFPGQPDVPNEWMQTYQSPAPAGITDATNLPTPVTPNAD